MTILVTGGAGFIGSHLTDFLVNEGHQVRVLDNLSGGYTRNVNPKALFTEGDLRNKKDCELAVKGVQTIFHLGAHAAEMQSVFTPIYNAETDYIGFLNLLVSAINEDVQTFVFTTSMARYGTQQKLPITEDQPTNPQDPYGICKVASERLLQVYNNVFGFNYVIIVPHNMYGPRQNLADPYRNVIGIWMNRILKGKPPIIYGDGQQTRAFSYIGDCIPPIAKSAFTARAYGEVINVGGEQVISIKRMAQLVLDKMGSKLKPIYRPEHPQAVKHTYCDHAKAKRILGYKPKTPLDEGIEKMAQWARSIGSQKFKYGSADLFEIKKKAPKVWIQREL